jgi:Zn-dependent M28 family amino/carboxypeptidase
MRIAGVDSFNNSLVQTFTGNNVNGTRTGKNIVGWIKGAKEPTKFIVVSAHYDHLGKVDGNTFYGADDNASGAACLPALAKYFKAKGYPYSLIFVAFDREETGLEGAYNFVRDAKTITGNASMLMNINIDMLARSDKNEIYACGVNHFIQFKPLIEKVRNQTAVKLLMGHDYGSPMNDWTHQSDHYAFYKSGIPFIYIGVENHDDYHEPTDTFDKINITAYLENCNMVATLINSLTAKMLETVRR